MFQSVYYKVYRFLGKLKKYFLLVFLSLEKLENIFKQKKKKNIIQSWVLTKLK